MTSRADLERHLYRAITNNRLGPQSHTVRNAIRELGRLDKPWEVAGVSRETWRRWNLAPGSKNAQKPSAAKQAGLLAALRRMRLSQGHEARIRASTGIHVHAFDNYEGVERDLGKSTFDWSGSHANAVINDIMNAYLVRGIGAAVDVWLDALPSGAGWAQEWIHPDSDGRSQSMDIRSISLTGDPARAGRTRQARRR